MQKIALLVLCFCRLLADPLIWSSPPDVLSTAGQNASEPRIGMDASGNLFAAWIENELVLANTKPLNSNWEKTPSIVSILGASSLQLVVDLAGNATAIWNQTGIIQSASLPYKGTWSAPTTLSAAGSSSPQIAVDDSGNLVAIWVCSGIIQSATKLFNGNWPFAPDTLSSGLATSDSPQIALGDFGQVVAVWHSVDHATDTIYAAWKPLSGTWSGPQAISSPTYPSVNPQVAVDPNGNAIAAWYRYTLSGSNYSSVIVQTCFLTAGRSWGTPADLSSPGLWNPADLVLKVHYNQIGIPLVLWNNSYDSITFAIEGTGYTPSGWIPTILFVRQNLYAYDLDFSISAGGYAFGAYMLADPSGASTIIQTLNSNTYSAFANIGSVEVISPSGSNGYPRISGTLSGSTKYSGAIWLSFDGSNNVVQSSFGQGNVLSPPTNLSVTQGSNDFGIFTEYYNTLTWEGTPQFPVAGFLIFRNGAVIGSGPPSFLKFVDHNQMQNGPVTYGVAFLEFSGNQSTISTISFP